MTKEKRGGLFIIVLLFSFLSYLLYTGKIKEVIRVVSNTNKSWLLLGVLCVFCYWVIESKIIQISTKSSISFGQAFRLSMIGQFFAGLTPFQTGGQPAQVYSMTKMKIKTGTATSALVGKFVIYQLVLVIYTALLLIIKSKVFYSHLEEMTLFVLLGFVINFCVIGFLLLLSFSRRFHYRFFSSIIVLLSRVRLIKDIEKTREKLTEFTYEFHEHMSHLKENIPMMIKMIVLTIIQLTFYFIVPFLIYKAFGLNGVSPLDIIAGTAFVLMVTSFIPLPGGSGGAEGGFYLIFSLFFISRYILPALLIWRFITYYMWMAIGGMYMLLHKEVVRSYI
jgi:uncharacterized protein (TIRG00374 family)